MSDIGAASTGALVTGVTSGIGAAIARRLAARGYHVFAHARNEAAGAAVVDDIRSNGQSAELLLGDFTNDDDIAGVLSHVERSGVDLAVVVNNAGGVVGEGSFQRGVLEDPVATYRVNVFAAYQVAMLASRFMTDGAIVNISSINAHSPWGARIPHYSAAKAALSHLTQSLAVKLAPAIRVNAVSPGRTRTEVWGAMTPEREAALARDQLIERWITPDEVADAVDFIAHNRACTGTDLIIDGGMGLKAVLSNV
jgi:3-oxoacyl-[acyl-carrier protein] reductase